MAVLHENEIDGYIGLYLLIYVICLRIRSVLDVVGFTASALMTLLVIHTC